MLGALARRIGRGRAATSATPTVMAEAMAEATEASYAAVGTPVEGTILTVARAASDAAVRRAADAARPGRATCSPRPPRPPARRSPTRPSSCEQLRDAGVVDAGGRGLCVVLDAAETGAHRPAPDRRAAAARHPRDPGAAAAPAT